MHKLSTYNGNDPYIFVSYSHKDTAIVMQMIDQMINDGYRVWYDEGIKPGSEWDEYIANKINKSGLFMAFISKNYLESDNCKDELNYSRDRIDNILLVYLSDINLPDGMELRFGRSQAIPAYNYTSKEEFFKKLYSAHGIERFKVGAISEETTIPAEFTAPVVEEPVRVAAKTSSNRKLIIIGIIAVLLVALVIAIAVGLSRKGADTDNSGAEDTEQEVAESYEFGSETTDEAVATSSEVASEIEAATNETTAASSTTAATTTEAVTESTTEDIGEDYENAHPFSIYGLGDGDTYYNGDDSEFYNNTGAVYVGYLEGDSYYGGSFHDTDTMSIRVPAMNDYSTPVMIEWYYINSNNEAQYLFTDYNVVPTMINDEMCYASTASSSALGTSSIPTGTYYVTVTRPYDGVDLTVTRFFYTE